MDLEGKSNKNDLCLQLSYIPRKQKSHIKKVEYIFKETLISENLCLSSKQLCLETGWWEVECGRKDIKSVC